MNITIDEANIISGQGKSKKLSINAKIGQYILDAVEYNNKTMTKSVLIYELLMFADTIPYEDSLTKFENRINNQLGANAIGTHVIDMYNYTDELDVYNNHHEYGYGDDEKRRMTVTMPTCVFNCVDWSRKWSDKIQESAEYYLKSAYDSRHDRITVKLDVLGLATGAATVDEVSDLAGDIYRQFQGEDKFNDVNLKNMADVAKYCDKVDDKKRLIYEVHKNDISSRSVLLRTFIEAFDYDDIYRANRIFNEACREYEIFEYSGHDTLFDSYRPSENQSGIDKLVESIDEIKSHDNYDLLVACGILDLSKSHKVEQVGTTEFVDIAQKCGITKEVNEHKSKHKRESDESRKIRDAVTSKSDKLTKAYRVVNIDINEHNSNRYVRDIKSR